VADDARPATTAEARAAQFAPALLAWFEQHGRKDLPWQRDPTAYRVWISEIMLQQTQVVTVIGYFERFMARFPNVRSLASAPLDEVLHLWSGLGYYARARNLHRAAQLLIERHAGEFPATLPTVMELPGIGRSTAAAILALCRGERHSILDGNVKRVLSRYFGVEGHPGVAAVEQQLWQLADMCTPHARVAAYTQGIMDLGATLCVRAKPDCGACPVQEACIARQTGRQAELPTARPRGVRPQRSVWLVMAVADDSCVLLERRPPSGIWGGLWALPEFDTVQDAERWVVKQLGVNRKPAKSEPLRHAFTHFDLEIQPLVVVCGKRTAMLEDSDRFLWYDPKQPASIGLPKPIATLIARSAVTPTGAQS